MLDRNMGALRARLDAIPAEIARETEAIRKRFKSPTWRLFPVALTYLVPDHIARRAAADARVRTQDSTAGGHA